MHYGLELLEEYLGRKLSFYCSGKFGTFVATFRAPASVACNENKGGRDLYCTWPDSYIHLQAKVKRALADSLLDLRG